LRGYQNGIVPTRLVHSSACEADHTNSSPSIAVSKSVFWETMRRPGLTFVLTNPANALGMVRRSWETKTRPSRAARVKTSKSERRRRPAVAAVWKSNGRLAAQHSRDDVFIEVGVCLEAYLHGFRRWLTFSIFLDSSSFLCRPGFACRACARNASNSRSCCRRQESTSAWWPR
jgi:hypothetical protein